MNMDEKMERMRGAEDILGIAADWLAAGETVAIATVIQSWGSSPRPAGSRMVLTKTGKMEGSVSGGCIEGAVADAALDVLNSGVSQVLEYGVTDETAWAVGLACGGRVSVLVEALT